MGHNIDRRISLHMVWSIILCLHGVKYHVIDVAGEGGDCNEIVLHMMNTFNMATVYSTK